MLVTFRPLAVLMAIFVLAGCYTTDAPLILPSDADYPFPATVDYMRVDTTGVNDPTQGRLERQGEFYVHSETGDGQVSYVLFRRLRDDYYLVQQSSAATGPMDYDSATTGSSDYDMVRITPEIVYLYNARCSENWDGPFIASGELRVQRTQAGVSCTPQSLDALRRLMESKIDDTNPVTELRILSTGP